MIERQIERQIEGKKERQKDRKIYRRIEIQIEGQQIGSPTCNRSASIEDLDVEGIQIDSRYIDRRID